LARGMAGGGLAQFGESDDPLFANFALFASSMQMPDGATLYLGQIHWAEAGTGLVLTSEWINQCIPIAGRTDGAEVRGKITPDGETRYPFLAYIFDAGTPGSGMDRVDLAVNTPEAQAFFPDDPIVDDFVYLAAGPLIAGDFQWIIRDIELDV
ncbi:MAG: hypothetical protein M3464_22355, partial [Chloroflexota bacterium]|nr:hypothetical protein [Chloroflexota bacterium]